jgi:N-acetylmuramoyl-L-alanine amidase
MKNSSSSWVGPWLGLWFGPRIAIALAAAILFAVSAQAGTRASADPRVEFVEGDRQDLVRAQVRDHGADASAFSSFALRDGAPRFVLDFARPIRFEGKASGRGSGSGPVSGYRFAPRGAGTRLVFDLASPEIDAVVETRNGDLAVVFQDASGAASAPSSPGPADHFPRSAKGKARRVVVVDPGHGGRDSGAIGVTGALEKDITLAAARTLRDALHARGLDVVMTRDTDEFVELAERVRRARAAGADLFICLHADSNPNRAAEGASIYTLSERGGARAKSLAHVQDWELDIAEPPRSAQVNDILLDLAQRETKNRSADFAQVAVRHLDPVAPLLPNARRNAGFFVLLAPDVPAILLEMGFLTNATDEARLTNTTRRRKMMDALADAAAEFLATPAAYADMR